ncbi:hypothetical protein B0I35DRAFT_485466 [Stachybotrys elegans]|uniref:Uncharacterized protein n=1 Tax=Stachybotrys elegans TaxID=80388 RepID=A0A8K0WIN8_9HYPO|nr:hypothetical protein B0I35DRAFT_485466 [Stachybotrys elegans]
MVLFPRIIRMIIKISQRVLIGEELASNKDWLDVIQNCTGGAFSAVPQLWEIHPILRPFKAWLALPQLRAIKAHKHRARELLGPVLETRLKDLEDPNFKPPPDLLQLIIDGAPDGKGRDLDWQLEAQIGTGRAALSLQRALFSTFSTIFASDLNTLSGCDKKPWK